METKKSIKLSDFFAFDKKVGLSFKTHTKTGVIDIVLGNKTLIYGENGSGKTTQSGKLIDFISNLEKYQFGRFDPISNDYDGQVSKIKDKIKNGSYIVKSSLVNPSKKSEIILCSIDLDNVVNNIFLYKENGEIYIAESFNTTGVNFLTSKNNSSENWVFTRNDAKFDKNVLMKNLDYLDVNLYNIEFINKFLVTEEVDEEIFIKKFITDMLTGSGYSEKQIEKIIDTINISEQDKLNFYVNASNYHHSLRWDPSTITDNEGKINFSLLANRAQEILGGYVITNMLIEGFEETINREELNSKINSKTIDALKLIRMIYYIKKIDQVSLIQTDGINLHLSEVHMGNFILTTNSNMVLSGGLYIPKSKTRTAMKNIDFYSDWRKEYYRREKSDFEQKLQSYEERQNALLNKQADVMELRRLMFEECGFSDRFDWDIKAHTFYDKMGQSISLSEGQNELINLIIWLSNSIAYSKDKNFLILDDAYKFIDYENKKAFIRMVAEFADQLGKKIIQVVFTHDIQTVDIFMNKNHLDNFSILYRDYEACQFHCQNKVFYKDSFRREDLAYNQLISSINESSATLQSNNIRIIYDWLKELFEDKTIKENFKKSIIFLKDLNKENHVSSMEWNEILLKTHREKTITFIDELQVFLPKKFKK